MLRLAHFSDLHFSHKNLKEADRCFGFAVEQAIAARVDVAVVSGDATDHALDIHAPAFICLASHIRRLADHCPVLMLQGTFSHEPPGALSVFRLLGGHFPVYVADRIVQVALTRKGQWLESASWRFETLPPDVQALFSCLPTVNKAVVAAAVGATTAASVVGENIDSVLRGFAPLHRIAQTAGLPTIGVSHGTVFGCLSEHDVPMAGFDHEFTIGGLFAAGADAFLLGHIHKQQQWQLAGQRIAYAGSIGRFHYGESGDKGFLLWEVEPHAAECQLIPTPARTTVDIAFNGKPDMAVLQQRLQAQSIEGCHVRVRWCIPVEDRHQVDRAALLQLLSGAADVKLEGRLLPVLRARETGITHATTLDGKIKVWAEATSVDVEPLLACLKELQAQPPSEIVERILMQREAA